MTDLDDLLRPPSQDDAAKFHEQLLSGFTPRPPLGVRLDSGGGRGKGIFATQHIRQGELIFAERAVAGVQHAENKADLPACPHCFRALATPERCVADILCSVIERVGRAAGGGGGGNDSGSGSGSDDGCSSMDPLEAAQRAQLIEAAVDSKTLQGLIAGTYRLPRSELLQTPQPVACVGGCDERYCSERCARAAWDQYHCLLCPVGDADSGGASSSSGGGGGGDTKGKGKAPAAALERAPPGGSRRGAGGSGAGGARSKGKGGAGAEEVMCGVRLRRGRLAAFLEDCDETNDMFRLAAQMLAITIVKADSELRALSQPQQQQPQQQQEEAEAGGAGSSPSGGGAPAAAGAAGGDPGRLRSEALQRAWLRFAAAQKAPYWEVAAVEEGEDEGEFRAQIREMTAQSLKLLRAAWVEVPWPELMELEVFASLVGMFEQNNLAINIPSPAERYFGLPHDAEAIPDAAERAALEQQLEPLRLALGDDLHAAAIEGTAFYSLQSCFNHSCAPNAVAEGYPSGEARFLALRDVAAGEELTISYIDEEEAGLEERRRALGEYGFTCRCERCETEELAAGVGALGVAP